MERQWSPWRHPVKKKTERELERQVEILQFGYSRTAEILKELRKMYIGELGPLADLMLFLLLL